MPLDKLVVPVPSGNLWLRHYSSLEKELFEGLYAALAEGYNGLPIRTDFQWRKLLAVHQLEKMQAAVVYHGSEPRGYMFYHIEDKTFFIQELVALTPDAKWALLRYAGEHQSSAKKFYWEAMEDDYTWLDFPEADRAGRVKPFMMAREDCPDGQVTLLLQDELLKENNSLVTLIADTGSLYLEKAAGDADAVVPMGAFTQLYFGAFTFTQLVEAGKIRMRSYRPELAAFLDALFPRCVNFINEYY